MKFHPLALPIAMLLTALSSTAFADPSVDPAVDPPEMARKARVEVSGAYGVSSDGSPGKEYGPALWSTELFRARAGYAPFRGLELGAQTEVMVPSGGPTQIGLAPYVRFFVPMRDDSWEVGFSASYGIAWTDFTSSQRQSVVDHYQGHGTELTWTFDARHWVSPSWGFGFGAFVVTSRARDDTSYDSKTPAPSGGPGMLGVELSLLFGS